MAGVTTEVPPGFSLQTAPRRREWRRHVAERGQSVEEYRARCANRRRPGREAFVIRPLGAESELLPALREYAEAYFGLPARIAAPRPAFDEAWRPQRGQANAAMILARLAEEVPDDALVCVGVVGEDLFAPGLRWVFGQGGLENRCAVISTARYGDADPAVTLRRTLKLLSHEAGHVLSIAHCARWRCAMQGANSREEDDGHPMHLCPEDLEKLCWNTGADPLGRYRALEAFYRSRGLAAEAAWTAARIAEAGVDPAPRPGHNRKRGADAPG
jgi:archaemetzincin